MNPENKIRKLIEESKITTNAQTEKTILSDAVEQMNKLKPQKSVLCGLYVWRMIMENKRARLAAMLALIIVITIGIFQFDQTGTALGQVKSAIHARLLYLKELVAGTNQSAPSPSSGQRGGRGVRRGQQAANNKTQDSVPNDIIINMLFLTIERKHEDLYSFFNKEKIKLNTVRNNPEIWYTKLASSQIERFKELAYTIDESKLRAKPKIGLKDGQEVILRSSDREDVFAFSAIANKLNNNDVEWSFASLFGQSEMEIPSVITQSNEAVLLCLTTPVTSQNGPSDGNTKIMLALIQTNAELPK